MELFIKLYQLVIVEAAYDAEVAHLQYAVLRNTQLHSVVQL